MFELTFRTTWVITSSGKVRVMTTTSELMTVRTIVVRKTAPSVNWCPKNESTGTAVVIVNRQTAATYRIAVALIRNLCTSVGKSMATMALARTLTKVSELIVITVLTRCAGTPLPLTRRLGTYVFKCLAVTHGTQGPLIGAGIRVRGQIGNCVVPVVCHGTIKLFASAWPGVDVMADV